MTHHYCNIGGIKVTNKRNKESTGRIKKHKNKEHIEEHFIAFLFGSYSSTILHEVFMSYQVRGLVRFSYYQTFHHLPLESLQKAN